MLASEVHHQCNFSFSYFISKYTAFSHAVLMYMQHDLGGITQVLAEELLQYMNNELHRGEIIVQKENAVKIGSLSSSPCAGQY